MNPGLTPGSVGRQVRVQTVNGGPDFGGTTIIASVRTLPGLFLGHSQFLRATDHSGIRNAQVVRHFLIIGTYTHFHLERGI